MILKLSIVLILVLMFADAGRQQIKLELTGDEADVITETEEMIKNNQNNDEKFHYGNEESMGIAVCNESKENLQIYCDLVLRSRYPIVSKPFENDEHKCQPIVICVFDENNTQKKVINMQGVECPPPPVTAESYYLVRSLQPRHFNAYIRTQLGIIPLGKYKVSYETLAEDETREINE